MQIMPVTQKNRTCRYSWNGYEANCAARIKAYATKYPGLKQLLKRSEVFDISAISYIAFIHNTNN